MTIKQIINDLLNKKWTFEDLMWLALMIFLAVMLTTPIFGVPIGIVLYFLFFYKDDDFDETAEKYDEEFKDNK